MRKTTKTTKDDPAIPSQSDDLNVCFVRMGTSRADKNFMINDPRFSEEAMNARREKRSAKWHREMKKELLAKFGK